MFYYQQYLLKLIHSISFEKEDILEIIRKLNVNKPQDHDEISIRMLKICDSEVVEPLSPAYKNCIDSGIFPDIWKRSHIIPTYKKIISNCSSSFFIINLRQNI